jgi:putative SOS response-associated peptidase YedK
MCGRYSLVKSEQDLKYYYRGALNGLDGFRGPNWNVAPSQTMPVVTSEGFEMMTWGLVPSWSKEFKVSFTTINARAEGLAEKPMYRGPFKRSRCLVPATGFYEWQKLAGGKKPYYFSIPGQELFSFAGLFDTWRSPGGEEFKSYTIITTTPNSVMEGVHDRMPVILSRQDEADWLNLAEPPEQLQLMLNPLESDEMVKWPVPAAVGNVRNNGPELQEKLA